MDQDQNFTDQPAGAGAQDGSGAQAGAQAGAPPMDDRDPQVLVYIAGLVYLRMGDDASPDEVQAEIDRVYQQFQDQVFKLAYDQLDPDKQAELKQIVDSGGSQTEIQQFVLQNIPDFQRQLEELIRKFQADYTGQDLDDLPGEPPSEPPPSSSEPVSTSREPEATTETEDNLREA